MGSIERITDRLEKPELDNRSYRVVRLANKLEALLVHDPDTDKASAAVNVEVEASQILMTCPGWPMPIRKENDYNQYLTAHSGFSNAFTTATETNYFFEVSATSDSTDQPNRQSAPNGSVNGTSGTEDLVSTETCTNGYSSPLYGALDRFAQFFVAPLFLQSTLDRELIALDSENKKNLQRDPCRLMQLNQSLSNPAHPYHRFPAGNLHTLKDEPTKRGLDVRSEIIKFYEKHYSSNRMKLVALGRDSLDKMEQWVIELFSGVKNKDLPQNRWDNVQPWLADDMCKQIFAKPIVDIHCMGISFPFLDEQRLYESQPGRYICHLIGHEGPGSILAYIRRKRWADGLSAVVLPVCPGSAFFIVTVRLTQEGLRQYREVAKVVFEYIAMIKEREPAQWILDQMKNLAELEFRFQQKSPASSFTSCLSSVMQKPLPREWLLSGSLLRTYNPDLIKDPLSYLRPDNFRMMIASQDYQGTWDSKEKWYGTEYKVENIPQDFMANIQQALETTPDTRRPDLHMPDKSEFVPAKLSVEKKETLDPQKAPKLIRHDNHVRLWFKRDDRFWVPMATVHVTLRNPLVYATLANLVKSKIYCELVRCALMDPYDAELAGLAYHLSPNIYGLDIFVSGYKDKMSVVLAKVLTSMRDLTVNSDSFLIIKESLAREYKNAEYQEPFYQVGDYTHYLTAEMTWLDEEYATELEHIEPEDISCFFPQLLRHNHIEVLAHGDLDKEDALHMTDMVENILKSRPLLQCQWHVRRNIIIPPGSNCTYKRPLKDPANVNNCIEYYIFLGSVTNDKLRSKLLLFARMTDEPALDQLRTKEQLGYVVWSGARYSATTIGYGVIIQSERTAEYLESRIDAFLSSFRTSLQDMTVKGFEEQKRSVINKLLEKAENLSSETWWYWNHIGSEYYDFLQNERDAANIRLLTKDDMIEFYNQYINPASPMRAKLAVHLNAQSSAHVAETDVEGQKPWLVAFLSKQLETSGFAVDEDRLGTALEKLGISTDGESKILDLFGTFLGGELSLSEQQTKSILQQAQKSLAPHLKRFDLKSKTTPAANGRLPSKHPIYITNIPDFKARLPLSAGPCPITDLSGFEDLDAKL